MKGEFKFETEILSKPVKNRSLQQETVFIETRLSSSVFLGDICEKLKKNDLRGPKCISLLDLQPFQRGLN